jgi:hypothetical protein
MRVLSVAPLRLLSWRLYTFRYRYSYGYVHLHTHTHTHRYALTIVVAPLLAERIRGTTLGDLLGLPRVTSKGFSHGLRLPYLPGRGL